MTFAWLILFWTSAAILLYVHVGYSLILRAISWMCAPRNLASHFELPTVSLIIPAHNEEAVLAAKLENSLALDYAADRLEIVVISDGSTDETVEIARFFESRGVRTVTNSVRCGKASVINDAVATTTGNVLCLCDANVLFRPDALRRLVSHLAHPTIGAVSGDVRLASHESNFGRGESLYYRVERWIQLHESIVGSMIGVDGGMYVVRRELFLPLRPDTILDDFVTSMRVIRQGKRIVYEPSSIATENGTPLASQEFRRRVRITAGAVQSFKRGEWPPLSRPAEFWQFVSHKLLRWTGPVWLSCLLVANVSLLNSGIIYQAILVAQLTIYSLAMLATALVGLRKTWFGGVAFYFVMSHVAMALGVVKGLLNLQKVSWPRTERSEKMGQSPFVHSTQRAVPANGDCTLFSKVSNEKGDMEATPVP